MPDIRYTPIIQRKEGLFWRNYTVEEAQAAGFYELEEGETAGFNPICLSHDGNLVLASDSTITSLFNVTRDLGEDAQGQAIRVRYDQSEILE